MLQIILVLAVACVAAYFIASSKKSKVEEVIKNTPAPLNSTFDPSFPVPFPIEEVAVKDEVVATAEQVEELKEAKKVVKKKSTPKKKVSK